MSILIKGMEMPTNCGDCYFEQIGAEEDEYGDTCISYCLLTEWRIALSNRDDMKLPSCPLVEIPTPHGRLIAEGSITDQLQEIEDVTALAHIDLGEEPYDDTDEIMLPISTIRKILDRCITIIEAEQ